MKEGSEREQRGGGRRKCGKKIITWKNTIVFKEEKKIKSIRKDTSKGRGGER